jgi:hypothetical protein
MTSHLPTAYTLKELGKRYHPLVEIDRVLKGLHAVGS